MQLGFVSAILPDLKLEEVLSFAADEGFGCVELRPDGRPERALTWAGEPLKRRGRGPYEPRGKLDTVTVNGPEDVFDWDTVDWRTHEENVARLRRRIFKATRVQDWARVRSLQKMVLGSWSNTLISVRRVTQRNAGRRTAVEAVQIDDGGERAASFRLRQIGLDRIRRFWGFAALNFPALLDLASAQRNALEPDQFLGRGGGLRTDDRGQHVGVTVELRPGVSEIGEQLWHGEDHDAHRLPMSMVA